MWIGYEGEEGEKAVGLRSEREWLEGRGVGKEEGGKDVDGKRGRQSVDDGDEHEGVMKVQLRTYPV